MNYRLINRSTDEETMCSKMVIDGFDYYVTNCEIKDGDYLIDDDMMFGQAMGNDKEQFEDCFKVIATNNPSIDLPKINEDLFNLDEHIGEWKYKLGLKESKENADKKFEEGYSTDSVKDKVSHRFGYMFGIKETEQRLVPIIMELKSHSFSEEDMIEFSWWLSENIGQFSDDKSAHFEKKYLKMWKEQRIKTLYYE